MTTSNRRPKEYSKSELIFGNLAIVLWISLGALSCWLFFPWAGLGYFLVLAFLVFWEIGKHGCATCYYCKTCTIGMGKLPEFFFKPSGNTNVNQRAQRLFKPVFVLLSVVPSVLIAYALVQGFTIHKAVLIAAILAFSVFSGVARRKTLLR